MIPVSLTIAAAAKTMLPGWSVDAVANGRDTLTCDVSSPDGSYRPALDDELIVVENVGASASSLTVGTGSKTFATQAGLPLTVGLRVRAYSEASETTWIEGAITSYSGTTLIVSIDTTSGTGTYSDWHIGPRIFGGVIQTPDERGEDDWGGPPILTRISAIDFNALVDRRYITATIPAGTLKAALLVVEPYLTTYGVTLDPGQAPGPNLPELVYSRAKAGDVFTELATLSGYVWEIDYYKVLRMFAPGTVSAPFNITTGDGHAIGDITTVTSRASAGMVYANRVIVQAGTPEVPIVAQAPLPASEPTAEQIAHGLWEIVIAAPTIFDQATAQALADAYLLQRTPTPKTVRYQTNDAGLKPGQTQTINIPTRNVNNVFILTEVRTQQDGDLLLRAVTALEGSIFQPGWRNLYQQWLQPLTQVTVVPGAAGGGRTVHFLGGSAVEYVQSPGPDWIPASAIQVILDTIARGSAAATITVRLRATAGSVTARLRNLSDGTTVGTSAAVSSTSWQTVTFSCTLTPGSKVYEIQVLSSIADTDVACVAYLE
jgi:hypothetical protein